MIRYLSIGEVLDLYLRLTSQSGGAVGLRDRSALESAIAQPCASFDGSDLYPDLATKAAVLGFTLVCNHPFLDGNKRIGHAAMEVMLLLNGFELAAEVAEQEAEILAVAAGERSRESFTRWVAEHIVPARE